MKRSRFVRDQLWPLAVVAFFFVAVTVAAFILAGGAKADPQSNYAAINAGPICETLDDYPTIAGVTGVLQGVMDDSGFSPYDAGRTIATAVVGWCPRNLPVLERFVAVYGPEAQPVVRA